MGTYGTKIHCTNCGASKFASYLWRGNPFCVPCSAVAEMLAIGARQPVILYEAGALAVSFSGLPLGMIAHRREPQSANGYKRAFSAVRFRVKMLDGSMWHGTGPTQNGTYIRLKPMKGA